MLRFVLLLSFSVVLAKVSTTEPRTTGPFVTTHYFTNVSTTGSVSTRTSTDFPTTYTNASETYSTLNTTDYSIASTTTTPQMCLGIDAMSKDSCESDSNCTTWCMKYTKLKLDQECWVCVRPITWNEKCVEPLFDYLENCEKVCGHCTDPDREGCVHCQCWNRTYCESQQANDYSFQCLSTPDDVCWFPQKKQDTEFYLTLTYPKRDLLISLAVLLVVVLISVGVLCCVC